MNIRDLLPAGRRKPDLPVSRSEAEQPFMALQREMNRLFEGFFSDYFPLRRFGDLPGSSFPQVDIRESNDRITVTAELPGMDEKDIDIRVSDDMLILSGEKRQESESNEAGYYRMERNYGSFRREMQLPCEVQSDRVEAVFKKGVLTIELPKTPHAARKVKQIPIRSG